MKIDIFYNEQKEKAQSIFEYIKSLLYSGCITQEIHNKTHQCIIYQSALSDIIINVRYIKCEDMIRGIKTDLAIVDTSLSDKIKNNIKWAIISKPQPVMGTLYF